MLMSMGPPATQQLIVCGRRIARGMCLLLSSTRDVPPPRPTLLPVKPSPQWGGPGS